MDARRHRRRSRSRRADRPSPPSRPWRATISFGVGLAVSQGAIADSLDMPMRTAGGRYAYAAAEWDLAEAAEAETVERHLSGVAAAVAETVPDEESEAGAPSQAQILGLRGAVGAVSAQTEQAAALPLTPIQAPLMLDDRYLGDLSGAVNTRGEGVVDAALFIDLISGVVSAQLLERLRTRIGAQTQIDMASLSDSAFTLEFDPFALVFRARPDASERARGDLFLAQREAIDPALFDQPAPFSAAAHVNLGQRYSHDLDEFAPIQGFVDIIANFGGFEGVTLTAGADYDGSSNDPWQRGEIRLSKDIFDSAIRLTAGEFAPPIDGFQGSSRLLGFSASRAYSVIRPFQNIRPSGRQEFVLERESYVEVEVNGIVTERLRLAPGPYSLADFPFGQGANTIRLLVEDDSGRREIAVFDLFGGGGLLQPGILDFGGSVGVLEEGGSLTYGSTLAASGFARYGVNNELTLGANAQFVDDVSQVGAVAVHGSALGLVQLSGAISHAADVGRSGSIIAVDYLKHFSFVERDDIRLTASFQQTSRYFQDAFALSGETRERWRAAAQIFARLREYTVSAGVSFIEGRTREADQRAYNFSVGRSFGRFGVNLSLGRQEIDGRTDDRIGLSLTTRLGRRWSGAARYDSRADRTEIGVSRSATGDLGDISGSARLTREREREALAAELRYINNRFEAQVVSNRQVSRTPGGDETSHESLWRAGATFAYADGAFAMGRPAREGFVIATRHDSLRGSQVALAEGGGRIAGRTGWFGPALAPVNRAYGTHRFTVVVDPLPVGYDLGSGAISTFPGYGSGYHFVIGSGASRTALGVLMGPDGPLSLISGTIEWIGSPDEPVVPNKPFFTNRSGRFVGDGLAPGRYRLISSGNVLGEFTIPEDSEGLVDVGVIQTD